MSSIRTERGRQHNNVAGSHLGGTLLASIRVTVQTPKRTLASNEFYYMPQMRTV
jgi:hypothetical protein